MCTPSDEYGSGKMLALCKGLMFVYLYFGWCCFNFVLALSLLTLPFPCPPPFLVSYCSRVSSPFTLVHLPCFFFHPSLHKPVRHCVIAGGQLFPWRPSLLNHTQVARVYDLLACVSRFPGNSVSFPMPADSFPSFCVLMCQFYKWTRLF